MAEIAMQSAVFEHLPPPPNPAHTDTASTLTSGSQIHAQTPHARPRHAPASQPATAHPSRDEAAEAEVVVVVAFGSR